MKDIVKFNKRQVAKKWIGRAALVGGGYGLARKVFKPVFEGFGGSGEYEGRS